VEVRYYFNNAMCIPEVRAYFHNAICIPEVRAYFNNAICIPEVRSYFHYAMCIPEVRSYFHYAMCILEVRSYFHNAICTPEVRSYFHQWILLWISYKSLPDDDPIRSKHVAVWILYRVVFDGCLFTPYFTFGDVCIAKNFWRFPSLLLNYIWKYTREKKAQWA
jgi:hypothetical protein